MKQEDYPLVLTVQNVAEIMNVHTDTVYAEIRKNRIPAVRMGRKIRIPRDRFFEWLNGSPTGVIQTDR